MKMWTVYFWEDGYNQMNYEYYSNKEAADDRAKEFNGGWINARVVEKELLDKPRKGAPQGYYWNDTETK